VTFSIAGCLAWLTQAGVQHAAGTARPPDLLQCFRGKAGGCCRAWGPPGIICGSVRPFANSLMLAARFSGRRTCLECGLAAETVAIGSPYITYEISVFGPRRPDSPGGGAFHARWIFARRNLPAGISSRRYFQKA
jgi:hypothetical protein